MEALLQFLFMFSLILAALSIMHMIPNQVIYWTCVVLSALYAAAAIDLHSYPAVIMSAYFAINAYLRVRLGGRSQS